MFFARQRQQELAGHGRGVAGCATRADSWFNKCGQYRQQMGYVNAVSAGWLGLAISL
jgi:hypothetical protein